MSFGINECATMVIKPLNFVLSPGYEEPIFHLGMYSIPKASVYIYLGIPFSNEFSLEPNIIWIQKFENLYFLSWVFYPIIKFH